MAADFPKAIEITNDFKATTAELGGIVKKLTPLYGTKGFVNKTFQVPGTDWILDVYAYRHAHSDDVTVIVLHSGSSTLSPDDHPLSCAKTFTLSTTPATLNQSHYPLRYDTKEYSYHINYTHDINMIGPDGKNPIPVELQYSETYIAQWMETTIEPHFLKFTQYHGQIHGMSVFNASHRTLTINLMQEPLSGPKYFGWIFIDVDS
ncbi:hypothetical protein BDP27DRAFT_1440664 [Rhodocollybia butyracea]|uniref:Uncharacterized protein n=1 Tax=Rhodocollybia butyracea TaxID=206335 RepID=A0A9P5TUR7_9AGAR|nr:hypothetical protein BDP27DRAFT_1440664 [Rhodocollybia butyracea]